MSSAATAAVDKIAEFGNRLVDLAEQVGGEAFPMLVKHTYVMGVAQVVSGALLAVLCAFSLRFGIKLIKRGWVDDEDFQLFTGFILLGAGGSGLIVNIVNLIPLAFSKMLAPEGATVLQILERMS